MSRLLPFLPWIFVLAACQRTSSEDEQTTSATARVQVEAAASQPMHRTLSAFGTVAFAPQSQQVVTTGAQVVIDEVMVVAGQEVRARQPLLRVRAAPGAVLEWERARTDNEAASREQRRVERMYAEHLATNADMASARQNALNARAAWNDAVIRGAAPGSRVISAPRDLQVASVDVNRGDIAAADSALMHLGNGADLEVRLGIEPADLVHVAQGQAVVLRPSYSPTIRVRGVVAQVLRPVDTQSRLSQALVRVASTRDLLPGSTVRAEIEITRPEPVLSVPRSAVLLDSGRPFVFVVRGHAARRVMVTTGEDDGDRVAIRAGVRPGDTVVVQGNYELEDGMAVVVEKAGNR